MSKRSKQSPKQSNLLNTRIIICAVVWLKHVETPDTHRAWSVCAVKGITSHDFLVNFLPNAHASGCVSNLQSANVYSMWSLRIWPTFLVSHDSEEDQIADTSAACNRVNFTESAFLFPPNTFQVPKFSLTLSAPRLEATTSFISLEWKTSMIIIRAPWLTLNSFSLDPSLPAKYCLPPLGPFLYAITKFALHTTWLFWLKDDWLLVQTWLLLSWYDTSCVQQLEAAHFNPGEELMDFWMLP